MKLEIGYNHPYEIRKYQYPFDKLAGTNILYLSDFHFNRFGKRLAENICATIAEIKPAIILLGGDYADSKRGLTYFRNMMECIAPHKFVCAVPGNHDITRIKLVRDIVESNNGIWLQENSTIIQLGKATIRIDGSGTIHPPVTPVISPSVTPVIPPPVTPAITLPGTSPVTRTATPQETADFSILLLHRPIDVRKIAHTYNLIFAGHLHGGQAVLWSTCKGLFPGRLVYKWNRLSVDYGNCQYLISKGLGDTLPIRYNCRKDSILVGINTTDEQYQKHSQPSTN
jgi:uncharacterized protein